MLNLEERIAVVESRVQEHAVQMADLRAIGAETRHEIRALRNDMNRKFGQMRDEMNRRFEQMRDEMNRRFERMDRRFDWLVGIVVTGFIAVIGTIAGTSWGLVQTLRSVTP